GMADVERDAALVAIEGEERDRHAVRRGVTVAALVPGSRRLDLDDLRAQIGEEGRAEGPGEEPGQVEDADAGERAHRCGTKVRSAESSASMSAYSVTSA